MKRILTYLILMTFLVQISFGQPEGDIAIENPRIIGNTFNFDIYIMRTNDHASWFTNDSAMMGGSSWWFTFNLADMATTYNITDVSSILFPPGAGYTQGVANIAGVRLAVTTTLPAVPSVANSRHMELDRWYFMLTVSAQITGNSANSSNIVWDEFNSAMTTVNNVSNYPTNWLDSDCDIALDTKCWTGSTDGNWDDVSNWSPAAGLPPSGVDIIYPNNPTNELSSKSNPPYYGVVQNLRINHFAEMHIAQSTGLTVTGDVTLMGGAKNLVLDAGNNLGTLSSSFIPQGTINYSGYSIEDGHIEVHRTLYFTETSSTYYMHQVAAPVGGVILDDWDMVPDFTYAYEWRTATQTWWNIYAPWRSTPSGYGFDISIYGQSSTTLDNVFTDNLVLTDQVINFDAVQAGQNALIGNPYTAPIDLNLVMVGQTDLGPQSYVWNPTGSYVIHVLGTGGNSSARFIQPGQAFFIEALNNGLSSISIDEADRTHDIVPYLKEEYPNLLRIFTSGGNETTTEAYIRFKEGDGVTTGYDNMHDGLYWPSEYGIYATEMYTRSSDGKNLGVDARPNLIGDMVSVPLHFKPAVDGEYTIHADEESMNSFATSISIMLEDTDEPQLDWIDMRLDGSYTFDAQQYDPTGRFILHFYDLEFGIEDGLAYEPIRIYSDRTDAFIINESEQLIKEIQVYDITGNLMTSKSTVNDAVTRIYVSDKVGYYVVRVITDKAVYSEKVLITK
jgi:hypothetical protein